MSTGKSAAKRESRKQRQMLAAQQRETQKELAEEKDIESRMRRGLRASKEGRGGLLAQQEGLKSLLGASMARDGSGGGDVGANIVTGGAGYFIEPTDAGKSLLSPNQNQAKPIDTDDQ